MEQTKNDNLTKIRTLLNGGARLTVLTYFRIASTFELRHFVAILRKDGLKISDQWMKNETTQKRYKIYWLQIE